MRRILYLPAAVLAYWAIAQTAPQPLSAIFPAGPLLYLESKDLSALLRDWNSSAEKSAWLQSANYEAFSRSRLLLKLVDAQKEFAAAAGVPPDFAMLGSVAGGNSALAMYHIGNLEFLYATHLASARAMDTALWKARGSYQTRHAGAVDYYLKEDAESHRVAAFAYAGDVLLLATKEELIAGALELLARQARPAVASEKWFQDATAAGGAPGELRLVYNLDRLVATPHFRSYWVQRNATALREFSAGIADLDRASGDFVERRALLRTNPTAAIADESATAALLAMVPDQAGFYRAWARPGAEQAARWIHEKFLEASSGPAPESKNAPAVGETAAAGSEQDLETRIDVPPLVDDRGPAGFNRMLAYLSSKNLEGMLEVSQSLADPDSVFVGMRSALVLLSDSWDAQAFDPGEASGELTIVARGKALVIGDSQQLVHAILNHTGTAAAGGGVYRAVWRHARELPNYQRMMRLIDFPQTPPKADPDADDAREPMFFSENLASLGRVLGRVREADIAVHDAGSMLRETVVYRVAR